MVVCIVPGMGTTLEGADILEREFPGYQIVPSPTSPNDGILRELHSMNALHSGLYHVLKDIGVGVTAVVGLSASEPCGLSLVGALDDLDKATEACADVYSRLQGTGSMLIVFDVSQSAVEAVIMEVGGTVALGAWFGSAAGAITGSTSDIASVQNIAENKGWKSMVPNTGYGDRIPFHCPLLFAPHQELLHRLFGQLEFAKPRLPYYSSCTGGRVTEGINGDCLYTSMAESARSFDAIRACIRDGHRQFIELNLTPLYERTVDEAFEAEGVMDKEACFYSCCSPSKAEMCALAKKLGG